MADISAEVTLEELAIEDYADTTITGFGKTVYYYKSKTVVKNRYGQAGQAFEDPVECTGRGILNPTSEQLSIVGNLQDVDVALLFSRKEMQRRFPTIAENEWMHEHDRLKYEDRTYKIIQIHPTGRIKNFASIFVVLESNIVGEYRQ